MLNEATKYATNKADLFKQSLQYLVEQQNQQKLLDEQALSQRYTNLVNQVNQKRLPVQQQYEQDAQGAYVNKMMGGQEIQQNLSRLGLNSGGFGISQQAANNTSYGQNLNSLMLNRNNQMTGINNEVTNIEGQKLTDVLGLNASYSGRMGELNQYIGEATNSKYEQEYSTFMKNKEFEEQLKQQAWDNDYKNRTLRASSSSGGSSGWTSGNSETAKSPEQIIKNDVLTQANEYIKSLGQGLLPIPTNTDKTPEQIQAYVNYLKKEYEPYADKTTTANSDLGVRAILGPKGPTKQNATNMLHPLAQVEENLKNSVTSASTKVIKQVSTPGIKLSKNAQTAIKMLPKNITATELRKILDKDVKYGKYTKKEADAIFNSFR